MRRRPDDTFVVCKRQKTEDHEINAGKINYIQILPEGILAVILELAIKAKLSYDIKNYISKFSYDIKNYSGKFAVAKSLRTVTKQFESAICLFLPCFAMNRLLKEEFNRLVDSPVYNSPWFTPYEWQVNEHITKFSEINGKLPHPSQAPLVALQIAIQTMLEFYQNNEFVELIYVAKNSSAALKFKISSKNNDSSYSEIIMQLIATRSGAEDYSAYAYVSVGYTEDEVLAEILQVKPAESFIIHNSYALEPENRFFNTLATLDPRAEYQNWNEEFLNILFTNRVYRTKAARTSLSYDQKFNPVVLEYSISNILKHLPRLPMPVFKLLSLIIPQGDTQKQLNLLANVIKSFRINSLFKKYQQRKLEDIYKNRIQYENIKPFFDSLSKIAVDLDPSERIKFEFKKTDGSFVIQNSFKCTEKVTYIIGDDSTEKNFTNYMHVQRDLNFVNFITPLDFINFIYTAAKGIEPKYESSQYIQEDLSENQFDYLGIDPSCQVSKNDRLKLHVKNSTFLHRKEAGHYCIIQVLFDDNGEFYFHLRFGQRTILNRTHFVSTSKRDFDQSIRLFNYWVKKLISGPDELRFTLADCDYLEDWHSEQLEKLTKSVLDGNEDVSVLQQLSIILPKNPILVSAFAELEYRLKGISAAMRFINYELECCPSNVHLWWRKAKIFKREDLYEEAVYCAALAVDMFTDEHSDFFEVLKVKQKFAEYYEKVQNQALNMTFPEESSLIMFIFHPVAIRQARNSTKNIFRTEFDYALRLLNEARKNSKLLNEEHVHVYPIERLVDLIFDADSLVESPANCDRIDFFERNMSLYGLANSLPQHNDTKWKQFWYYTHPLNIPYILKHGINVNETFGAYFYFNYYSNSDVFKKLDISPFLFMNKNTCYYAVLLVNIELKDCLTYYHAPQIPRENSKIGCFFIESANEIRIFDKSLIGSVCFISIQPVCDNKTDFGTEQFSFWKQKRQVNPGGDSYSE